MTTVAPTSVREEAERWFRESWDPEMPLGEWWERLAESGWGYPTWPERWFGRGLTSDQAKQVDAARAAVGAIGPPSGIGVMMAGPTIVDHGTEEQCQRFLPDMVTGKQVWCQLFSDPGAAQGLDTDQRILAAADRDQCVSLGCLCAQAQCGRRGRRRGVGGKTDPCMQVQAVAVGEFAQAVEVHGVEECRGIGIDAVALDADLPRHGRLVIADARDQMQQAQRVFRRRRAGRVQLERRARHAHGLHQLGAVVEGIRQLRDAGCGIEVAAHEAEGANRIALEHPVIHPATPSSSSCSTGKARRL